MGPSGNNADHINGKRRNDNPSGFKFNFVDNFFDGDNCRPRAQECFALCSENSPQVDISFSVCLLRVNDGDVGFECSNRQELFARERTHYYLRVFSIFGEIGAPISAQYREGNPRGTGDIPIRHDSVGVFLEFKGHRPFILHGVAKSIQRAGTGVTSPGKDKSAGAPSANEHVVNQIRGHPDEFEIFSPLPNDLFAR